VTAAVRREAKGLRDLEFVPLGTRRLKGLADEVELFEVVGRARGRATQRLADPVCGMEPGAEEAAARMSLGGRERVFCSQTCLQCFVAAPERYAGGEPRSRADDAASSRSRASRGCPGSSPGAAPLCKSVNGGSVSAVLPGRVMRVACALAVTVGVHAAYAVPSRAERELRAVSCCAKRCPRCDSVGRPLRCCQLAPWLTEPATLSSAKRPAPRAALQPLAAAARPVPLAEHCRACAAAPGPRLERAGPIFLLTRSLRL